MALLGIYLGQRLNNPYFDGAASLIIGLLLMFVASLLAYESRSLLIGDSALTGVRNSIDAIVRQDPNVAEADESLTLQLGPSRVLVNLEIQFRPELSCKELTAAFQGLESEIRRQHPEVQEVFLRPRNGH